MFKSIDLFSGTGALTLALEGIAEPALYCDNNENVRKLLAHNINRSYLPRAPIHDDIQTLKGPLVPGVEMVVGGFPCIGFSAMGKREGFKNSESGLFSEMIRVIDECGAELVFMENVPRVQTEMSVIEKAFKDRGFTLRMIIIGASDVGAPQQRKRWYGIAFKPASRLLKRSLDVLGKLEMYNWSRTTEPPRTLEGNPDANMRRTCTIRWKMLGNGVVPQAARLAFLMLWSSGHVTHLEKGGHSVFSDLNNPVLIDKGTSRGTGVMQKEKKITEVNGLGSRTVKCPINIPLVKTGQLVLDPTLRPRPETRNSSQRAELLTTKKYLTRWATPRSNSTSSRVMTTRTIKDLSTQIRFEQGTENREGVLNIQFVEWMMGLVPGYTEMNYSP